jgi:hypothetical protein
LVLPVRDDLGLFRGDAAWGLVRTRAALVGHGLAAGTVFFFWFLALFAKDFHK